MNIRAKKIIIDTNVITDLDRACILKEFISLDNVYMCDLVKNDEINFKTGNVEIISEFKVMSVTPSQLIEVSSLSLIEKKLSIYDLLNYVVARDNDCVLATGDSRLKSYCENNGVLVFRTLKIIRLMIEQNVITKKKAIAACNLLLADDSTRIPKEDIENLIDEFERDLVIT